MSAVCQAIALNRTMSPSPVLPRLVGVTFVVPVETPDGWEQGARHKRKGPISIKGSKTFRVNALVEGQS